MSFSELFPEIDRYWSIEMRSGRLSVGALTALAVGFCLFTAAQSASDPGSVLFWSSFGVQCAVLLGYGTARMTGCILNERIARTWDLQRLTPLSSAEIAGGKLLGAPLFAYFLAACMIPWTLIGCFTAKTGAVGSVFWNHALLGSGAFLLLSAGLLVSAYADHNVVGTASPATAAALMGFAGLQAAVVLARAIGKSGELEYFGVSLGARAMLVVSMAAFGLWALAAARWRIGKDLLEGRRFWRLPAFLCFLTLYQLGFASSFGPAYPASLVLPCFFCYFAAVLNSETAESWKRWSKAEGLDWFNEMPAWLAACGVFLLLSLAVTLGSQAQADPSRRIYPFLQSAFLIRDACFLQWCRFTTSRRPEMMALVFIGLAYFLPGILLAAFKADAVHWFYPVAPGVTGWQSLGPAWLQAAAAAAALASRWRALSRV